MDVVIASDGDYYASRVVHSMGIECGTVFFALFGEDLPTSQRWRSRGRHDPGSGDYSCTTVSNPGGLAGMWRGNDLYLSTYPLAYEDFGWYRVYRQFSGKTWEQTRILHEYGHTYCEYRFMVLNRVENGTAYYGCWIYNGVIANGYIDYDRARQMCNAASWYAQDGTAISRRISPTEFRPAFSDLGKDNTFLPDLVQAGMPNLGAHLNSAYVDAYQSLPAITTNNIQNLLQVFSSLAKLVTGGVGKYEGFGTLSDAWLGYRYSYSTTKSDIEELAMYVDRMRNFRSLNKVRGHGQYKVESEDSTWLIKCSLECSVDDYLGCYTDMERLGLALDGYNTWDLIPYSFILDWFFRIGDLLEIARSRNYAMKLSPSAVWFSVTHDFTNSLGYHQCDYYRWKQSSMDFVSTLPSSYLTDGSKSLSTWVKRGADALALLL